MENRLRLWIIFITNEAWQSRAKETVLSPMEIPMIGVVQLYLFTYRKKTIFNTVMQGHGLSRSRKTLIHSLISVSEKSFQV